MVLIQFFKEDETKRVALLDYLKDNFGYKFEKHFTEKSEKYFLIIPI